MIYIIVCNKDLENTFSESFLCFFLSVRYTVRNNSIPGQIFVAEMKIFPTATSQMDDECDQMIVCLRR